MSGVTPAVRVLRQHAVPFVEHHYDYEERGGTRVSSRELGVDEHIIIKTLVMQDEARQPLIVLMHGYREVSTKNSHGRSARRPWLRATPRRLSGTPATR